MPYLRIWIHMVWTTKNREPFLTKDIRYKVFEHMRENSRLKGIYMDHINGYVDHVHCLISLSGTQDVATIAHLLKGESAHWINKQGWLDERFSWQEEYFAASVSHSQVDKVRAYIRNQERHHQRQTFEEEFEKFIDKYGFRQG